MINRDSRGRPVSILFTSPPYKRRLTPRQYLIARGEILGFIKDELLRKHSPRMFSLISERKLGDRRRLCGRPQQH